MGENGHHVIVDGENNNFPKIKWPVVIKNITIIYAENIVKIFWHWHKNMVASIVTTVLYTFCSDEFCSTGISMEHIIWLWSLIRFIFIGEELWWVLSAEAEAEPEWMITASAHYGTKRCLQSHWRIFLFYVHDTQTLQLMHSDWEVLYLVKKKVTTLNLTCIDAKTFASFFLSPLLVWLGIIRVNK